VRNDKLINVVGAKQIASTVSELNAISNCKLVGVITKGKSYYPKGNKPKSILFFRQ